MLCIYGFVLFIFNVLLLGWFILSSVVWLSDHKRGISCFLVPPILLFISLCLCIASIWVHSNFLS